MSDPIREAYDARRLLMQRLNAILDDRWPLAGKIMAAVDEYAEARSTPAEALDVVALKVAAEFQDHHPKGRFCECGWRGDLSPATTHHEHLMLRVLHAIGATDD